jgi:hypothetical protein
MLGDVSALAGALSLGAAGLAGAAAALGAAAGFGAAGALAAICIPPSKWPYGTGYGIAANTGL